MVPDPGRRGLTDTDLVQARTGLLSDFRARAATTYGAAGLATDALAGAQPLDDIARYPALLQAVTQDDIRRVASQYLAATALRLVVVGAPTLRPELALLGLGPVERRNEWAEPMP